FGSPTVALSSADIRNDPRGADEKRRTRLTDDSDGQSFQIGGTDRLVGADGGDHIGRHGHLFLGCLSSGGSYVRRDVSGLDRSRGGQFSGHHWRRRPHGPTGSTFRRTGE